MNVLVTGGAGYIGSVTVELLADAGHQVTVFDNLERGHRPAVDPRASFIQGDLRDPAAVTAAVRETRPDAVMHFAAYAIVAESMAQPDMYFRNNVVGGLNLLDAAAAASVRKFVFSSTCAVYGTPEQVPIPETAATRPVNPYGESKLALEKMLQWYQLLHGIEAVILRYFNAAGATNRCGEEHDPETHLIANVLDVAAGRITELTVFGDDYDTPDGTCIRDYIHVADLAQAHILALTSGCAGVFNLGTGIGFSVKEVHSAAEKIVGRPIPVKIGPRRPGDPPILIAAADRARDTLGWKPCRSDLENIIRTAWQWKKLHPSGYAA